MNAALDRPSDLAPYGAAELKTVARTYLARALAAGSGAWLLGFALAVALYPILLAEPDVPIVPYDGIYELIPWKQRMIDPAPHSGGSSKAPIDHGVIRPVDLPDPALVEADPASSSSEPAGSEGEVSPCAEASPTAHEVVVLPERGRYVQRDTEPLPTFSPKPLYPELAVAAGLEGRVTILVLVGRDGSVVQAEAVRPFPMLDEAAVEAVRRWRFSPALDQGRPVAVWISVPVVFSLH